MKEYKNRNKRNAICYKNLTSIMFYSFILEMWYQDYTVIPEKNKDLFQNSCFIERKNMGIKENHRFTINLLSP